ncbi:unannotated protein [freshwater metagenome]|uniref:Unannotated protein n=1 Tax=freshwater metagenome TaxID=449393 RepID=A0A6J6ZZB2_9ZZZZ
MGGVKVANGDVVQEKQRLCTLANKVVNTHGHEVDADGIESPYGAGH